MFTLVFSAWRLSCPTRLETSQPSRTQAITSTIRPTTSICALMARRFRSCSIRSRLLSFILPPNYFRSPNWRGICRLPLTQKSLSNIVRSRSRISLSDSLTDYRRDRHHCRSLLNSSLLLSFNAPLILSPIISNLTLHSFVFRSFILTCSVSTGKEPDNTSQQSTAYYDCGKPDKKHRQGCNEPCQCTAAD